jgi:hypothetical protein
MRCNYAHGSPVNLKLRPPRGFPNKFRLEVFEEKMSRLIFVRKPSPCDGKDAVT